MSTQHGIGSLMNAADRAQAARPALADKQLAAIEQATEKYEAERAAAG